MATAHSCIRCLGPAALMCYRCREYYCSADCQTVDWPHHKTLCIPMPALVPITSTSKHVPDGQRRKVTTSGGAAGPQLQLPPKVTAELPASSLSSSAAGVVGALTLNMSGAGIVPARSLKPSTIHDIEASKMMVEACAPAPPQSLQQRLMQANKKGATPVASASSAPPAVSQQAAFVVLPTTESAAAVVVNTTAAPLKPVDLMPNSAALQAILQRRRHNLPLAAVADVVKPSLATSVPTLASPTVPAIGLHAADPIRPPAPAAVVAPVAPWQKHAVLEPEVVYQLMVQHIDEDDNAVVWTVLASQESACMQLLTDINNSLVDIRAGAPMTVPTAALSAGQLFAVPYEDVYYRAVVLQATPALDEVYFQLIDYGNKLYVPVDQVRAPLALMLERPAFGIRLRLRRKRVPAIGETLHVRMHDIDSEGVHRCEEVAMSAPAQQQPPVVVSTAPIVSACQMPSEPSLVASDRQPPQNPPAVTVVHAVATVEDAAVLPMFTLMDLKVTPLPVGQPLKLSCLDNSELGNGLITAAQFDAVALRHVTQALTQRIADYCNGPLAQTCSPQPGELCLAVFEDDGNWYRAVCVEAAHQPDGAHLQVMFVDFGNVAKVAVANVRRMPAEMVAEPCLANSCVIDGVPDRIPLDRISAYLEASPVFPCLSATELDKSCYLIQVNV